MANVPHYRSQFGDTTFTKVFVGGLAWETPTEEMRRYFEQFGEILEAVIITEKTTGKSKGYGFVTFRDPESARRACADPNPVIDGRRANCNIASLGRPRPSPPRGRLNQGANPYQGTMQQAPQSYSGTAASVPPPPPPVIFPPYGYPTYTPDYGYHSGLYSPQAHQQQQYYHQLYGSASNPMGNPYAYYYGGYSMQGMNPRGTYSTTAHHQQPQVQMPTGPAAPYLYYPSQMEGSFQSYPHPPPLQLPRLPFHPSTATTDSQGSSQHTSTEAGGAGGVASESPKT